MRLIDADKLANSLKNNLQSFEEMISEHGKGLAHGTRIALNRIAEQPTISPESLQPQWIPVAERLPDKLVPVLIQHTYMEWAGISIGYITADDYWEWFGYFMGDDMLHHPAPGDGMICPGNEYVNAWMSLPEPYTADAEENEGVQPAHWEKADIPLPYQMRTVPTPSGTFAHREMYVCSACDGYNDKNTQYCPHCGAKMDKEVNDDD